MTTVLADHNVEGQAVLIWGTLSAQGWLELVPMSLLRLADVGLPIDSSDRDIWRFAQANQMLLLTDNRNLDDADSLEQTILDENTEKSLPDALLVQYRPRPIASEQQYRRVMRQIEALMRKRNPTRAEEDLLELLATLAARYEERHFPSPDVTPGEVLAHLIEVRGVSKVEVAASTGIARQTITNIVSGARGISASNRAKLAEFFHVSPNLFVSGV
jgi:antitoxin component HigA of HigAB toxin-antitoxin module